MQAAGHILLQEIKQLMTTLLLHLTFNVRCISVQHPPGLTFQFKFHYHLKGRKGEINSTISQN